MGSFTSKAGIAAAVVMVGLGLTALPASADKASDSVLDRAQDKAFSKAIGGERQAKGLTAAKEIGDKKTKDTTIPCTNGVGDELALRNAITAASGDATTTHNLILGAGCTYTLTAAPAALASGTDLMITGNSATIVAFGGARHFTVLAGAALRISNTTLRGTNTAGTGGIENHGSLALYSSTATLNRSGVGGAMFNFGDAGIFSSVIGSDQMVFGGGVFSGHGYMVVSNSDASTSAGGGTKK